MMSTAQQAIWRAALAFLLLGALASGLSAAPKVSLAARGKAQRPVVIGTHASERVKAAATTLATYLGRISGAEFSVVEGDGKSGIVVGVPADFTALPINTPFNATSFGREDYVLRSRARGLWVLGATDTGVENAVWDLLYRLGHRQFFPGKTWEVVPASRTLAIAVDVTESPDFYARRIWYNWGMWGYNNQPYQEWCVRNRHRQGFQLNSGHVYESIIAANRAAFNAHPEYFSLVNGQRRTGGDAKFCVSNPDLRRLVVEYAVRVFKNNPAMDSISMDPSDGDNWCECEDCARMGSPSNRALTLANDVALAINDLGIGPKYVGMYAYNRHSPPPTIAVHPNVIISATTAFLRGGFSLDQIIDGWKAKGATLGIYDYFSVIEWDWNLPGRAKAARPHGVAASIRTFYNKGARFYDCESGDAWGPYGLGYYIGARTMWDVNEADRVDKLIDDFLTRAFGPAKEPMSRFYVLINMDTARRSWPDQVGRMYRCLAEARVKAAGKPDVLARINDLILYTRYVEQYNRYASLTGDAQGKAMNELVTYVYRIRATSMVHAYGFWARTAGQNAAHQANHPLKNEEPVSEQEITTFLEQGIANNQPVEMGFTPVDFSQDLVPATPLRLPDVPSGSFPTVPQDRQTYYVWVPTAPADITLQVTVQKVWDLRPHRVSLYSPLEVSLNAVAESTIVRPDGQTYEVVLHTTHEGLHRVEITDGGDYTRIVWPEGMPVTLPSGIDSPSIGTHFRGAWTLYFYVPKGTKAVGGWAARIAQWAPRISGLMKDGGGNTVFDFSTMEDGWFSVPVPAGQDGRLWKFENTQGVRQLMTVPPCLARNGSELLLPREVVARDAK